MGETTPGEVVTHFKKIKMGPELERIAGRLEKANRAQAGRLLGLTEQERFLLQTAEPDADNLEKYLAWFDSLPAHKQLYAKMLPQAARVRLKYTLERLKHR